jgi:hypothetical protein
MIVLEAFERCSFVGVGISPKGLTPSMISWFFENVVAYSKSNPPAHAIEFFPRQ